MLMELLFWRKSAETRKTSVFLFVDNSMQILLRYISLRIWEDVCHTPLKKNNKNEQMMSKGFSAEFARALEFEPWCREVQRCLNTAVKPAAVQKNTVKPAAIEINVRVYYNDYGNHRNNTKGTRF